MRDKIERRYANALGQAELAENTVDARMREVQQSGIQMAGHSRLEQIRAEMNAPKSVEGTKADAIEAPSTASSAADAAAQPNTASDDAVQARLRELRGEQ